MPTELLTILAIISILAVIQSMFGMGILVFGTPTLLLMGFDFITSLSYLLPASFAISILQVLSPKSTRAPVSIHLYLLCLPAIVVGLWLIESSDIGPWLNLIIGWTLIVSAIIRFWEPSRTVLTTLLKRNQALYHLLMGLIHGLTNLGGAFLTILASAADQDKNAIRSTIAQYYLAFSTIQMVFLVVFMGHFDIFVSHALTAVVSAAVYLLIGNRIFSYTRNATYNTALTFFIALYGIVIVVKL